MVEIQGARGPSRAQLESMILALTSRVEAIEAKLGTPPVDPPTEPEHRVLIGASVDSVPSWPSCWASLEAAIGRLQAVRSFDPYEATNPANLFVRVAGLGLEIHSSTKSLNPDSQARLAYYQAVKATGENVVAYTYHEPDDNMNRGEFTYETWREAAMTDAFACQSVGIAYGICWQLFGALGWPDLIDKLVNDRDLLALTDVMGWDTYQRGNTPYKQATYRPWSYNGDQITALMARMPDHLQVVIPEFGVPEHPTDPEYRPTYLADMREQAHAQKWRAVLPYNYWRPATPTSNHASTGPEFLYDTPECREASRVMMAALVSEGRAAP
jgi:hypothetical protein